MCAVVSGDWWIGGPLVRQVTNLPLFETGLFCWAPSCHSIGHIIE